MDGTVRKGVTLTWVAKWKYNILELSMTYDRDIYLMNLTTYIFPGKNQWAETSETE